MTVSIRCHSCDIVATGITLGVAQFNAGRRGLSRRGPHWFCADHLPAAPPCPHGSGGPCSQCLGAPAHLVTIDETGEIRLDGVAVDSEREREARANARAMARTARGNAGRKQRKHAKGEADA